MHLEADLQRVIEWAEEKSRKWAFSLSNASAYGVDFRRHLQEAVGERRDVDVFLCGLRAMVDDVRNILKEMGFDRKQILYEKYD